MDCEFFFEKRTDCHTSDIGHWFAMTGLTKKPQTVIASITTREKRATIPGLPVRTRTRQSGFLRL